MGNRRDSSTLSRFHLGDLHVHPDRMVVVRDGVDIPLEPLWMEILVVLAQKACSADETDRTVSTSELMLEVWKTDRYTDNPVTKAISGLRKAIGDDTHNPRYIKTIHRRGYRVIAPVLLPDGYLRLSNPADIWRHGNPYVGLAAFDAEHADVFVGRNNVTAKLLDAMSAQIDNELRFVLLVGASGCGKTSLLRAGALPRLTSEKRASPLHSISVADCDLSAITDGDLLMPLASALCAWSLPGGQVFSMQTPGSLKERLSEAPEAIPTLLTQAFQRHPMRDLEANPHAHLLLIVDHAEALVSTPRSPDALAAFEHALCALCETPRVLVMMVARSDYYPQLVQALPALTARKAGGHIDLLAPNRGEISEIIRRPAELASLQFETGESRLDDALRDAAVGQPDALPLLQHTLHALYERRTEQGTLTWDAYRSIGGLEGAIAHHAEQVFSALPAQAQAALDTVLGRLVVHGTESDAVTARRVRRDSLSDDANTLVDAFIAGRLFVATLQDGHPHVGVAHEALLRQWPRAREWADENRRLLKAKAQLQIAAKRWDDDKRSDDHLLNPGRPLSEAQEVSRRFPDEMTDGMLALLHGSEKWRRRRHRIRTAAMTAMTALIIISMVLAGITLHVRNIAEKRDRESLELNSYILGELTKELRQREMLEEQRDIAIQTISNYKSRNLSTMSATELATLARAYRLLGEAQRNERNVEDARTSFEKAYELAKLALRKEPSHENALFESGNAAYWIGMLEYDQKRYAKTAPHWDEYRTSSLRLANLGPTNPLWMMEVSFSENNLGTLALRQGAPRAALRYFKASTIAKVKAMNLDINTPDHRAQLADSISWIATALEASGHLAEASSQYESSITMLRKLIEKKRVANSWRLRLSNILVLHAKLEIGRGNLDGAERHATNAIQNLERFVEFFPYNDEWSRDLANARLTMAEIATLRSDHDTARNELSLVLEAIPKLNKESNNDVSWKWIDAQARFALSALDRKLESNNAIDDLRALADSSHSEDIGESLAYALLQRGHARARAGNMKGAKDDFLDVITVLEKTTWKRHPFRTWLWSEAMQHSGKTRESAEKTIWLSLIGYARRCPD